MLENGTSAAEAGEGAVASGADNDGGNVAENTQDNGTTQDGQNQPEGGANDDDELRSLGLDPTDKRGLKTRFTTLSQTAREAQEAAAEAERQAAYWRGKAEGAGGGNADPAPARRVVDPNPAPDASDKTKYPLGADDPQYIEDRAVWRVRNEQAAERAAQEQADRARADFNTRREAFLSARDKASTNPDTPAAAQQLSDMPSLFVDIVAGSEHADLIAQHFATNKAEYDALYKQHIVVKEETRQTRDGPRRVEVCYWKTPSSPLAFAKKVGVLESSLPGVFASRKATKAPLPAERVAGGGGAAATKEPSKMSTEEYRAWRAAGNG